MKVCCSIGIIKESIGANALKSISSLEDGLKSFVRRSAPRLDEMEGMFDSLMGDSISNLGEGLASFVDDSVPEIEVLGETFEQLGEGVAE